MGDARGGHQVQHAIQKPIAGAQDGGEDQLLALDDRRGHRAHRAFRASAVSSSMSRVTS